MFKQGIWAELIKVHIHVIGFMILQIITIVFVLIYFCEEYLVNYGLFQH